MTRLPDTLIKATKRLRERISVDQLLFSFTRSTGPGGQNVNKVSTRVTLLFDLAGTLSLSRREKDRIFEKLGTRINKGGQLRVVSTRHRTQSANRRAAAERFYELIAGALAQAAKRVPTRPTQGSKRRRLDEKRKQGSQKRLRRDNPLDG